MNDILDEAASPGFAAPMAGLAREHPADIVERLNTKSIDIASAALSALPLERAAEVFDEPGLERAEELIEAQPPERAASLFRAMSDDRAADIFRHLDEPVRERLFAQLDLETKASVARLLAYPENTAGSIMTTEFVSVPSTLTVGETLDYVRKVEKTRETIYAIYVLDPNQDPGKARVAPPARHRRARRSGIVGRSSPPANHGTAVCGSRGRGQAYLQIRSFGRAGRG
jgi:Mg/Co/Ni transporter MgtE